MAQQNSSSNSQGGNSQATLNQQANVAQQLLAAQLAQLQAAQLAQLQAFLPTSFLARFRAKYFDKFEGDLVRLVYSKMF